MFRKLFLIIISFSLFLINLPAQAQFIQTNLIEINTTQEDDKLILDYTISHTFPTNQNRGIFLSLPTFSDGVWLDYKVNSITKSSLTNPEPVSEPYSIIKERDQFRFRIGEKNTFLAPETYEYNFQLETQINPDYKISPVYLRDWLDPLKEVRLNGQPVCSGDLTCQGIKVSETINPGGEKISQFGKFFNLNRLYIFSFTSITIISYLLWFILARDPKLPKITKDGTRYEPPKGLHPWQSQFILSEGSLDLKKTLVSYLLWLNHNKYISIKPDNSQKKPKMEITKKKKLPTGLLPSIFNKSIDLMVSKGIKKGLLSSKLNPGQHSEKLHSHVYKTIQDKYSQKPFSPAASFGVWLGISLILVIGGIILFNVFQETLLLGDSWIGFGMVNIFFFLPFLLVIVRKWGNLNKQGIMDKIHIKEYRYFLDYVLKDKLDFSNNPRDGVQYYLKNVPYAASFGMLAGFNKYFGKILPKNNQVNNSGLLATNLNSARFYTPPSSSSGGGGYSGGGGGFSGGGGSW